MPILVGSEMCIRYSCRNSGIPQGKEKSDCSRSELPCAVYPPATDRIPVQPDPSSNLWRTSVYGHGNRQQSEGGCLMARNPQDYKGTLKPTWCPGCGDFGVLTALFQ